MNIWHKWMEVVDHLKPACSRKRTFLWMVAFLIGFTIREDMAGVTSFIRVLGLLPKCYDRLLYFIHSPALNIELLTKLWVKCVLKFLGSNLEEVNGRFILVGDGIKIPKEGKKMPAVKLLHQSSDSNTKAEYIMGHSCQTIAILAKAAKGFFAVPLASRIHEGLVFCNRHKVTLLDKMIKLIHSLEMPKHYYFVGDAYYAALPIIKPLIQNDNHLISRVKSNAVAHKILKSSKKTRGRGRPKLYGKKVKLKTLYSIKEGWQETVSPYNNDKHSVQYLSKELMLRRAGTKALFVAVKHPTRGKCIMMTTDTTLSPLEVIRLYGLRFKIEVSFKAMVHNIGSYGYHFWMKIMDPIKKITGNQYLHRRSKKYRDLVKRKINAYHRFIQLGVIAQGLMQYLSINFSDLVWKKFGSWVRTIRPGVAPSEQIVAMSLRNSFPEFLVAFSKWSNVKKFIQDRLDFSRTKLMRLIA